jgi:hypothetical protein
MESIALEPKAALEAHGTKRISELDSLRGFLLVWMTLTHLPTRVSAYSNQVIGYTSAAEGFILLAAVLTGQIQSRAKAQYGDAVARKKLFRRALRIYSYHLVLLGTAFCLGSAAAVYLHRRQLQYLLDFFIDHPAISILAAPLLLYNPPLLDILPMYILFMLLTPTVLWAAERRGWTQVLGASGCVWLLAQCNLRGWIYSGLAHWRFPIPLHEMGAFDVFAWQFLWISGLALSGMRFPSRWPKWLVTLCGAIALVLFVCRHAAFDAVTGPVLFDVLVDKWRLGILRLVDAAALGILLLRFGSPLANSALGARLAILGRASLEVFAAHVICCFAFLGVGQADGHLALWQDAVILAMTLRSLFWVAERVRRRRADSSHPLREVTR